MSIDFGDTNATDDDALTHLYAIPGLYAATAHGVVDGTSLTHRFNVVQMDDQYHSGFTGSVIAPATADLLSVVFPALTIGHVGDDTMALGFAADDSGQIGPDQWVFLTCEPHPDLRFNCHSDRIVVAAKDPFGPVGFVGSLVFLGAHFTLDNDGLCEFSGVTLVNSIVDATVAFAGYEPADALSLVAGLLGYTPETIPEDVPLAISYTFEMDTGTDAGP